MKNRLKLEGYDLVIVNSSGGKDSIAAIWEIIRMADEQGYDRSKIVVSHQDLGAQEWSGTKEIVKRQADHFGLRVEYSKRRDINGKEETLLEYVLRRGNWPSSEQRWCTSDYKRGPGARVVTRLTADMPNSRVLYVFGFRMQESPARKKKKKITQAKHLITRRRMVRQYLPIHNWTEERVWKVIKENKLPYHFAYDLGMPRLSCIFCILAPFDALVIAGIHNPEMLDEYIAAEDATGKTFKAKMSLKEVKKAIEEGYRPRNIKSWTM